MFTVTNDAAARLADRLAKEKDNDETTFRFVREDHGWRLQLGQMEDGDKVIQHRDKPVLVLDSDVADGLSNRMLDLAQTEAGPRLRLHRRSETGDVTG